MKKYELVRDLVKSLNEGEAKLLEKFLVSFDEVKNPESVKTLKLFILLRESDLTLTEDSVMKVISKDYKTESFSKLLTRLKDKIYDTLILDSNIFRKETYSEQFQKKFYLRKLTSVASIIHGRGNVPHAMELYEKIIIGCKEFEIYNDLIETLRIVQEVKGISEGEETYKNIQSQILFYERCRSAVYKAKHYYHEVITIVDFHANSEKEREFLESKIKELEEELELTNSATVEYFLLYLKIHFSQINNEMAEAVLLNNKLVNLIKNNKAIYQRRTMANALNEYANNLQLLGKFYEADEVLNEVFPLLPTNSFNTAVAKEMKFLSCFYCNRHSEAEEIIEELLSNKYYNMSEFIRSKRTFFKANLFFFKKDFSQVHKLLQECKELENDREGWNYGIRILSIINDIERGLHDLADNKIENLRKFISRSKGATSERYVIVHKIFYQLVKNSFNYKATFEACRNNFFELENHYSWKIRTAELFPFEEWFKTKMDETDYHFKVDRLIPAVKSE